MLFLDAAVCAFLTAANKKSSADASEVHVRGMARVSDEMNPWPVFSMFVHQCGVELRMWLSLLKQGVDESTRRDKTMEKRNP